MSVNLILLNGSSILNNRQSRYEFIVDETYEYFYTKISYRSPDPMEFTLIFIHIFRKACFLKIS